MPQKRVTRLLITKQSIFCQENKIRLTWSIYHAGLSGRMAEFIKREERQVKAAHREGLPE